MVAVFQCKDISKLKKGFVFDVVEASDDPENGMFPRFLLLSLSFFFRMVYLFYINECCQYVYVGLV